MILVYLAVMFGHGMIVGAGILAGLRDDRIGQLRSQLDSLSRRHNHTLRENGYYRAELWKRDHGPYRGAVGR